MNYVVDNPNTLRGNLLSQEMSLQLERSFKLL